MVAIPAHLKKATWAGGGRSGSFTPNGTRLRYVGNREGWSSSSPVWAARLFVGLSVGDKAAWSIEDVIAVVRRVRTKQTGSPDSSFLAQKGIYKSRASGGVVEEDAVQVVIINTPDLEVAPRDFRAQMVDLGEALTRALKQEEVIVELQRGGVVRETIGVYKD